MNIFNDIPKNYDEFIHFNNIEEWPFRLTSEKIIPLKEEIFDFQDASFITECLENQISINLAPLDELDLKLKAHEEYLMSYVNQILNVENIFHPKPNKNLEDKKKFFETLGAKVRLTSNEVASLKKFIDTDASTIHELNLKSVELYQYDGFNDEEFNDIPGSSDVMRLIHLTVKNTKIPKSYRHAFKKIFFSEASVGIVHDLFWWIFLDYFKNEENNVDKEKLFSRISLNFGILLLSIPDSMKDGFLQLYPEQIALTLYCAFYHSFTDSRRLFGPDFKQKIINICHLWMTGIHPLPNSFNLWPIDKILYSNDTFTDDKRDTKPTLPIIKSHPIGPSFIYSKTLFDTKGCCPLIHKFLQLHDIEPTRSYDSKCAHRLEVQNVSESETYKSKVKLLRENMDKRKEFYDEATTTNENELLAIAKRRKELEKRFERLESELNTKTSILDMRVSVEKFSKE